MCYACGEDVVARGAEGDDGAAHVVPRPEAHYIRHIRLDYIRHIRLDYMRHIRLDHKHPPLGIPVARPEAHYISISDEIRDYSLETLY